MRILTGCGFAVLGFLATAGAYFWFLLPRVRATPVAVILSLFAALLVWVLIGAVHGLVAGRRDRALIDRATRGDAPRDGKKIAAIGTIVALGEPLTAPFSGARCVAYSYEVDRTSVIDQGEKVERREVHDWRGLALAPCAVRGYGGDLRLLAFPEYELVPRVQVADARAFERAAEFLGRTRFIEASPSPLRRLRQAFGALTEALADDDGAVDLHWRAGNAPFTPGEHRLFERRVAPGEPVCVLGRYSAAKGGIVSRLGSGEQVRLVPGDAATARSTVAQTKPVHLAAALFFVLAIHGALVAVVRVTDSERRGGDGRIERTVDGRSIHDLVRTGDVEDIRAFAAAGGDLDATDASGSSVLFATDDPELRFLLLELGADPDGRDHEGDTLLQEEVGEGDLDVVRRLVAAGADLEARSTTYGTTALERAVLADRREAVEILRAAGARDFRVDAASGEPLPAGGGPPFAVSRAYLDLHRGGDPSGLGRLVAWDVTGPVTAEDLAAASGARPVVEPRFVEGWWNDAAATLKVSGRTPDGSLVTWMHHLVRRPAEALAEAGSAGEEGRADGWRLEREWWLVRDSE